MIILRLLLLLTNLHLKLLSTQGTGADKLLSTQRVKDHSKIVVGSFYRPPDKGIEPILNLETELSEITEKFRNNSKYTVILGGDFNAANIDWDTGIVEASFCSSRSGVDADTKGSN